MTAVTLGAGYFDAMYDAAPDPWGFQDRWYERRKYAISLAQLPERRYRSAFEPGCSRSAPANRGGGSGRGRDGCPSGSDDPTPARSCSGGSGNGWNVGYHSGRRCSRDWPGGGWQYCLPDLDLTVVWSKARRV